MHAVSWRIINIFYNFIIIFMKFIFIMIYNEYYEYNDIMNIIIFIIIYEIFIIS